MRTLRCWTGAAVLALWVPLAVAQTPPVVINEVVYDDSGTDDREFVELYNAGLAPIDISGWMLRASDTVAPPGDNNPDYTIPAGTVLTPGQYYVIGAATVPNVDFVVGSTNLWENSNEAIELVDQGGFVVDTVVYELNKGPVAIGPAEGGIWGNFTSIDGSLQSWARYIDGRDTNNNGRDFGLRPMTPGANNLGSGSLVPTYTLSDVDLLNVGDPHPGLTSGSFVGAQVIDPTVASAANPNAIPPSPQGGLASVAWDPSGGGNAVVSDDVVTGGGFELFAYLDTNPLGAAGAESTTYGIMGTTATFYNLPDPSGLLFGDVVTANGNTGIGWLFEKEDSSGLISLKLIDFGDGGDSSPGASTPQDWIVIADLDLSGTPSGWHLLSIDYDPVSGEVTARFDNQVFDFTTETDLVGAFYIGYRESLAGVPSNLRPPTFDMVPEPASLVLLAVGLLALRRR